MSFLFAVRADWRALSAAALIGSGLGLGLGAAYLVGGMDAAVADHARAARTAEMDAYSGDAVPPEASGLTTAVAFTVPAPAAAAFRQPAGTAARARELDCLTAAVYYEARGETPSGQAAVAQVVLNRVRHPAYPKTVCGVVYQGAGRRGCQFSFACDGVAGVVSDSGAWKRARRVAGRALAGARMAAVGSATHFHTTGVSPSWGPQMFRVAQVGMHVFYRLVPGRAQGGFARRAADDRPRAVFTSFNPSAQAAVGPAVQELRLSVALLEPSKDPSAASRPSAAPEAAGPSAGQDPAPPSAASAVSPAPPAS